MTTKLEQLETELAEMITTANQKTAELRERWAEVGRIKDELAALLESLDYDGDADRRDIANLTSTLETLRQVNQATEANARKHKLALQKMHTAIANVKRQVLQIDDAIARQREMLDSGLFAYKRRKLEAQLAALDAAEVACKDEIVRLLAWRQTLAPDDATFEAPHQPPPMNQRRHY